MTKQVSPAGASSAAATTAASTVASSSTAAANSEKSIAPKNTVSKKSGAPKGGAAKAGAKAGGAAKANAPAPTVGAAVAEKGANAGTTNTDATPVRLKGRHAALRYTTLRMALFLGALVLVWAVAALLHMDLTTDTSRLIMIAVALFLSSAASLVVLSRQRDEMSAGIVARTQRLGRKFNDAATFEDGEEG
ncbi:MAG TPA: DUF4229 domain-containing protein [Actinocrinis sp.]|jgi:hypothetical protein